MKITLLYHRLEWGEHAMLNYLSQRGVSVDTLSLDNAIEAPAQAHDVIVNRVYASVANQDDRLLRKALQALQCLEALGKRCINNTASSQADYDKLLQFELMHKAGVSTPLSLAINSFADWQAQRATISQLPYPVILKRRAGGRAQQLFRLDTPAALERKVHELLIDSPPDSYHSGYLLQPCLHSSRSYDVRIAIINDQFAYSYGRSLVARHAGEAPWIGSGELGSTLVDYGAGADAIELAKRASRAMQSCLNEVDLLYTEQGPVVIENNLTPNFTPQKHHYLEILCDNLLAAVSS